MTATTGETNGLAQAFFGGGGVKALIPFMTNLLK